MSETIAAELNRAITSLVQSAPSLDAGTVAALLATLRSTSLPLAIAIAEVLERVAAGEIDQAVALPALAMACATLADGLVGKLTARELEAARFEIETLLPIPGARPTAPVVPDGVPDVSIDALLSREPRRRT